MQLFIELCSAKKSWLDLDEPARQQYLRQVGPLMQRLSEQGVEIIAWGKKNPGTPERAPFDYFGVFKFPNEAAAALYESTFRSAGWYEYFDQVNISGACEDYAVVLKQLVDL